VKLLFSNMRLITGDECGLLKEYIPELSRKKVDPEANAKPFTSMPDVTKDGVCRIDPHEKQTRERGVVDMMWMGPGGSSGTHQDFSFAALRSNGSIEMWRAQTDTLKDHGRYSLVHSTKNVFKDEKPRALGLGVFDKHQRMCVGDMLGNVVVMKYGENDISHKIDHYNVYESNKRGNTISYTPGQAINTQLATAIGFDAAQGRVAVGGRERETTIIDIATGKQVFRTKNLPPDPQTLLQQPVWPTAIQFLNQDCNVMAVGTAYKQLRLYDVREDSKIRRPTQTTPEGLFEYRPSSLCQVDDYDLVVGDTAGYIYSVDLRRLGRDLKAAANRDMGRYLGPAGSVRQLKKHPTLPRLAAVGLDRMLYVYDTMKRKQLHCAYLKQRLNCVLFSGDDTWDLDTEDNIVHGIDPDDVDIDQDDVVQDYFDSDDDENDEDDEGNIDEESHVSSEQEDSKEDEMSDREVESNEDEIVGARDSSDDDDDSKSAEENESSSDPREEEEEDISKHGFEDSDDDEVIVVKAPKRRRRR
jgi:ribosome biogenesis protein NSA1